MAVVGEALVTKCIMNTLFKDVETNQRMKLLYTRYFVKEKVCNLIINGGSCTNVASCEHLEKLGLANLKQTQTYRPQLLNDCADMMVIRQVLVSFSIEKYVDEVLWIWCQCMLSIFYYGDRRI